VSSARSPRRATPPTLAVTTGEPAGIGPDLCLALLARKRLACRIVLVGDQTLYARSLRKSQRKLDLPLFDPTDATVRRRVEALHVPLRAPCAPGTLDVANAPYVLETLDMAIGGCAAGVFQGIVTAPVHKGVINDAGVPFSGHTEYFADATGTPIPVMLLVGAGLRVALATTHLPLAKVSAAIQPRRLESLLAIMDHDLRARFGIRRPRILVLGLNPHAGESGHLGREEIEVITPTLERLRKQGLRLEGPVPADTAFLPHRLEGIDAVLAMYHDQGLPVLKHASFGHAVNVTLGLPIIRTSVDHGTALDRAGTSQGDPGSLLAAVDLAVELASRAHRPRR
jgi:4-hydroxythreonine-4-phosphate dehydrogenase